MWSPVEYPKSIEIDTEGDVWVVTFTANGEYLVSGGWRGVQVWRVEDGRRVASLTTQAEDVYSVAVSEDGRFIAAGTVRGDVRVWDTTTYELQISADDIIGGYPVYDVNFSPDSSHLVSADNFNREATVTIWDIVARKKVRTLEHENWVYAAKYSPPGDRIATATEEYIRVWDSVDGRLLAHIKAVGLEPLCGLLWFNSHLFVKTRNSTIRRIDLSTGSTVSEWSVPSAQNPRITLPQHGQFIAYSTSDSITIWDTSTHIQLDLISRISKACAIAFSPNDRLAIIVRERRIIIKDPPFIGDPDIRVESGPLYAWKNGQLTKAESLLTATLGPKDTAYNVLARRAIVRARLRRWEAALADAEESIKIQSSDLGYIAKFVALVGSGGVYAGCRMWDDASLRFHSDDLAFLLLLKAIVLFMAGDHEDGISRIDDLIAVRPSHMTLYVVQAYMHLLHGNLHMENGNYEHAIRSLHDARVILGNRMDQPPLLISLISGWKFDDLAVVIRRQSCEALLLAGYIERAGTYMLRMVEGGLVVSESIKTWVTDFAHRCLSTPEDNHNASSASDGRNDLSHPMMPLLRGWVESRPTTGSWEDILAATVNFTLPRFTIYQAICEYLEGTGQLVDAIACFHQMCDERAREIVGEQENWIQEFKSRCSGKLANLGDMAMNAEDYGGAILQYTTALRLNPAALHDLLGQRSKAHAAKGEWQNALNDANVIVRLSPSSPLGYERKHAALHGTGHYGDATDAFETMLLKMSESPDPDIRERSRRFISRQQTEETISEAIQDTIRDSPPTLINTISGRLCHKAEQASAFESEPAFMKLISSMTTEIDHASIKDEVGKFYRYATFSHKWQENEPLYEKVINIVVYDLEASPTHKKLQMFCKIVREAGFNWAWSDTCCIDQTNHFVLQEALVSMFRWYEDSAMTIIFLLGVNRLAERGALTRSIWNMRAWTLQEYHASKVVRIYTADWTPYLNLKIHNHKESPEIISEMEEATGISAQALVALRPGLDDIREKLRLASVRQTMRVEDSAYSLLGIFSVTLPVTYGEGDKALSRLLAQLLASSGDTSILAWKGRSGTFNSCLPSSITVFRHPPTSHIPSAIPDDEMRTTTSGLRPTNLTLMTRLYDQLNSLPVPSFSGCRMKLPCLAFKLGQVSVSQSGSAYTFRAQTKILGIVEIRTQEDLSKLDSLCLIHPWIDFLLDRHPVGKITETTAREKMDDGSSVLAELPSFLVPSAVASTARQTRTARLMSRLGLPFGGHSAVETTSLLPPSTLSPSEREIRVLQLIARLRRPFGALLLTPTRRNVEEYRRVAAESLITVQVKEITPEILEKLIKSARILDVL